MCQNRPKMTDFLTTFCDILTTFCDIYFFFWANLQLSYNFFIKSKNITKKNKISRQILFFFWPKRPLLWSPKKGQKRRKRISLLLGPGRNMIKSLKCNHIPRENWVKSSLSKYAYYRRLCSITGWIWHFCEKPSFSTIRLKKKVISQSKMYPNMILDLPYYISKNVKKKLNFDFEIESRL